MLDYPFADVIDLTVEHLDRHRRTQPQENIQGPRTPVGSRQEVVYRKADDSWF